MMKKILMLSILLPLAVSSFAQEKTPNRFLFIDGTADRKDHIEFFQKNFNIEAAAAGYTVVDSKVKAAHTVKFAVSLNMTTGRDGILRQASSEDNKYAIEVSLVRNSDNFEILVYNFYFNELDDMYEYNSIIFLNAMYYIPPISEDDLIAARNVDNRWRNKWLYVRGSFDYPITFYKLVKDKKKLIGGIGLYGGSFEEPSGTEPLDHKIMAMPGMTIGAEGQVLDIMSIELNYQLSMGDTRDNYFVNMALGLEIKFPNKLFENFIISPYGTFVYNLRVSPVFKDFPLFAAGAGIQVNTKGGKSGAFFIDVKYILSFTDAVMHNPYLSFPENERLHPNPAEINYSRSVIGIGIGYKFGFFDRKETVYGKKKEVPESSEEPETPVETTPAINR